MDEQTKRVVKEIIERLAQRFGADGTKGKLVVVFSGATVGMDEAMQQVKGLIYDGYQVLTAFSDNAQDMFGTWIEDQLLGLPFVDAIVPSNWYSVFTEAKAVVVPLLSLNTAAKVSSLIADTLPANLMLHALAAGKPLCAALNGAHPGEHHWVAGGNAAPAFRQAALARLKRLETFGCRLTYVKNLRNEVNRAIAGSAPPFKTSAGILSGVSDHEGFVTLAQGVVTAAYIREAHKQGAGLCLPPGAIITPLARDLAMRMGVKLIDSE